MADPITAILTALATGAATAATETASAAIKDAYQGLKKLLQSRFANKPAAVVTLDEYERNPEVWRKPLESALVESGASGDSEIIRCTAQLTTLLRDAGAFRAEVHGSGAAATSGGVAAGQGGIAVGRDYNVGSRRND